MILGEVFAARRLDVHYAAQTIRVYRNNEVVHIHHLNEDKEVVRANRIVVNNTSSYIRDGMTICAERLRRYLNNQPIEENMHTKIVDRVDEKKTNQLTFGDLSILDAFRLVNNDDGRVYMKSNIKNSIVIKNSVPNHIGMHRAFHLGEFVERVDLTLVVG